VRESKNSPFLPALPCVCCSPFLPLQGMVRRGSCRGGAPEADVRVPAAGVHRCTRGAHAGAPPAAPGRAPAAPGAPSVGTGYTRTQSSPGRRSGPQAHPWWDHLRGPGPAAKSLRQLKRFRALCREPGGALLRVQQGGGAAREVPAWRVAVPAVWQGAVWTWGW